MMPHEYEVEIRKLKALVTGIVNKVNELIERVTELEEEQPPLNEINQAVNVAIDKLIDELKQDKVIEKGKKK